MKGNPIGEKTLKMIYAAMRKKPNMEYEDILNSLWDKLTQAERLIMYKTNTRLSDKIVRGYDALINYDKISGMI